MNRKLLISLLVFISCLSCVFGFAACGDNKPENSGNGQGTVQIPPEEKPDDTEKPSEGNKPSEDNKPTEPEKPSAVEATGVSLNKATLSLEVDENETLTATVAPSNATDKTVTWESSDSTVVKVENGKVTALKAGTASITATAGSKSVTCTVTVSNNSVEIMAIYLNKTSLSLYIGDSETLTETVFPVNATESVSWISTAPSVATVKNGKVTGVSEGEAMIIASSPSGKTATCTIMVTENTNGCVFEEYGDGYAVTAYNGTSTSVTVPSTYKGRKIVAIGTSKRDGLVFVADGFADCYNLVEINIPDTVKVIGFGAFKNCESLKELVIPNGVTQLGRNMLYGCVELKKLTLPYVNYQLKNIFDDNSVPDSLKEVVITGGAISAEAFDNCSGLTKVTIGNSVTEIGNEAFINCSGLTSVTIGSGVTSIGEWAFAGCSKLTEIIWNAENCTQAGSSDYPIFSGSDISTLTISKNVKTIPAYAFYGCSGLTNVTIPDSVLSVNNDAFKNCNGLTSITIGKGVARTPLAFDGCSGLIEIIWNAENCISSTNVDVFRNHSKLSRVTIGEAVKIIPSDVFGESSGIKNIYYNGNILDWCSINGLSKLMSSTRTLYIGGNEIKGELIIPNGVTSISAGAFKNCKGLSSVTISDSVTEIGAYAFYNCSGLTSVTIGNGVTSIGEWALGICGSTIINYSGTKVQWNSISKGTDWNWGTYDGVIHCADGDIAKS